VLTTILVIFLVAALAQGIPGYILGQRAKRRVLELEAENYKLAELVLADQKEWLLLPENVATASDFMELMAKADKMVAETKADDGLDQLLNLIGERDLTGVEQGMAERRKIAIFRFGDLAVRDASTRENWSPDIFYKNVWISVLRGERATRFRVIVDQKLLEAVTRDALICETKQS
jgi:hypothetical protein